MTPSFPVVAQQQLYLLTPDKSGLIKENHVNVRFNRIPNFLWNFSFFVIQFQVKSFSKGLLLFLTTRRSTHLSSSRQNSNRILAGNQKPQNLANHRNQIWIRIRNRKRGFALYLNSDSVCSTIVNVVSTSILSVPPFCYLASASRLPKNNWIVIDLQTNDRSLTQNEHTHSG